MSKFVWLSAIGVIFAIYIAGVFMVGFWTPNRVYEHYKRVSYCQKQVENLKSDNPEKRKQALLHSVDYPCEPAQREVGIEAGITAIQSDKDNNVRYWVAYFLYLEFTDVSAEQQRRIVTALSQSVMEDADTQNRELVTGFLTDAVETYTKRNEVDVNLIALWQKASTSKNEEVGSTAKYLLTNYTNSSSSAGRLAAQPLHSE